MREIMVFGKIARLEERYYKNILKRWDFSKAKGCAVRISCKLCKDYGDGYNCGFCPLAVFSGHGFHHGCMRLIYKVLTDSQKYTIKISPNKIAWDSSRESQLSAKRAFKKIRGMLLELEEK